MQYNNRLLAVMSAILADTAHEELLDAGLIVLCHDHSWRVEVLCPDAYNFTYRVLVSIEVSDFNLMWNLVRFGLGDKPLLDEVLCFTDLQTVDVM